MEQQAAGSYLGPPLWMGDLKLQPVGEKDACVYYSIQVTALYSLTHRGAACAAWALAGGFCIGSDLRHGDIVGDISVVPTGQFFFLFGANQTIVFVKVPF